MTPEQLVAAMPFCAPGRAIVFAAPLTAAMEEFEISTPQRKAAFLAQIAVESGSLHYVREIADGAAYDVGAKAIALGNTPENDDDGERYKGRGLMQLTGRANYAACGQALGLDLLRHPEILETPTGACRSAAWFWKSRNLNAFADRDAFVSLTRAINGGLNGGDERCSAWIKARRAFGI